MESPVDGEEESAFAALGVRRFCHPLQRLFEFFDARSRVSGDRYDRLIGQKCIRKQRFGVVHRHFEHLFVDEVYFVDNCQSVFYAQQREDGQVFARLRHHAVVGGDDEHYRVYARRSRHHLADEFFMSGNVDDAYRLPRRQGEGGKAQLDRHAALFFLR